MLLQSWYSFWYGSIYFCFLALSQIFAKFINSVFWSDQTSWFSGMSWSPPEFFGWRLFFSFLWSNSRSSKYGSDFVVLPSVFIRSMIHHPTILYNLQITFIFPLWWISKTLCQFITDTLWHFIILPIHWNAILFFSYNSALDSLIVLLVHP